MKPHPVKCHFYPFLLIGLCLVDPGFSAEGSKVGPDITAKNYALSRMVLLQRGPDLTDMLLDALRDPDLGVRQIALSNLDIAISDPRVLPALRLQLQSPPNTRWLAARAIASIPAAFVGLQDELARLAGDPDPFIRRALLANIAPGPGVEGVARPLLESALRGTDVSDLMAAARSWARLKLVLPDPIVDEFGAELGKTDEVMAGAASYALTALWNGRIEEKVRELTRGGPWSQRVRAADLLRKRQVALDLSLYSGIFSEADEACQLYACGTFSRLPRADTADLLRQAGASRFHSVRQAAVYTLEAIGSDAARRVLVELLDSKHANVRRRAAIVLGRIGPDATAAAKLQALAASDPDGAVKTAAAIAVATDFSAILPSMATLAASASGEHPRIAATHGSSAALRDGVVQVGTGKQLVVDDFSLESLGGATRVFHKFVKDPRNPVLEQQFPWEKPGMLGFSPSLDYDPDSKLLRLYYYGKSFAVSSDGVHWTQPNMGLYEYQGSKANNQVGAAHNIVRLHRPYRDRYRFAAYSATRGKDAYFMDMPISVPFSVTASFSPDGLKDWTKPTVVGSQGSDVLSLAREDIADGYLGFEKWQGAWWMGESFGPVHGFLMKPSLRTLTGSRRSFATLFGPKPDELQPGRLNIYPLEGDDQAAPRYVAKDFGGLDFFAAEEMHAEIYQITSFPYEGIFFLIPSVFYVSGPGVANDDGLIRLSLMFSRDKTGASGWNRNGHERFEPIMDMGRWGEWDSDRNYGGSNSIMVINDEIVLYYTGFSFGHNAEGSGAGHRNYFRASVGRATMRLDGLASLHAGEREAAILTKPLAFQGDRLTVNVKGEIQAEILDGDNRPIAGFEREKCALFRGDAIRHSLVWSGGDFASLAGKTMRVRFYLKNGDLYSYRFTAASDRR